MTVYAFDRDVFEELSTNNKLELDANCPVLFILGSTRTGSTLVYQMIASALRFPFITNKTEKEYASQPLLGLLHLLPYLKQEEIHLHSVRGKTRGALQPSEGSAVLRNWFGGQHPSQVASKDFLEGAETHFVKTIAAVNAIFGRPLLIKNAWNCYRVASIYAACPNARFLWIRRNAIDSARSDMLARRKVHGTARTWSSATPHNIDKLKNLPDYAQVLESQYEFNNAIQSDLNKLGKSNSMEIWYRDLICSPTESMQKIGRWLSHPIFNDIGEDFGMSKPEKSPVLLKNGDNESLREYWNDNAKRLSKCLSVGGK